MGTAGGEHEVVMEWGGIMPIRIFTVEGLYEIEKTLCAILSLKNEQDALSKRG